jgi:hypothetical protein
MCGYKAFYFRLQLDTYIVTSIRSAVFEIISEVRNGGMTKRIPAQLNNWSNQFRLGVALWKQSNEFNHSFNLQ